MTGSASSQNALPRWRVCKLILLHRPEAIQGGYDVVGTATQFESRQQKWRDMPEVLTNFPNVENFHALIDLKIAGYEGCE
jgi:hypothetical protein